MGGGYYTEKDSQYNGKKYGYSRKKSAKLKKMQYDYFKQVISLVKIQHFSTAMTIKYPRKIYGNPATDFDRKLKQ